MSGDVDARPLQTAAVKQAPLALGGSILSGPAYLAALTTAALPIGRTDILIAALISLVSAALPLLALRRAVQTAQPLVTPNARPRDDQGRALTARDDDVLRQAVEEVARGWGYSKPAARPPEPAPSGPAGTATLTPVTPGPPSADPGVYGGDYAGDAVRAHDEARARARGRHPAGRARAPAGGARHGYRGGPADGGPR